MPPRRRSPMIRRVQPTDLDAILDLAAAKRAEYATHQPAFWRPARDGRAKQDAFLRRSLAGEDVVAFVSETGGAVDGFVIGTVLPAPAVFADDGPVCVVDDFATAGHDGWAAAGAALLEALADEARRRGATLIAVVSGHRDAHKRRMLARAGLVAESGWHVREHAGAPAGGVATAGAVRPATAADAGAILAIAQRARSPYQRYQRSLWRRAGTDRAQQLAAVAAIIADANTVARVHDRGEVDAFAFGTVVAAPPVYDPGGPVCLVDDLVVAWADGWATAGAALLEEVSAAGRERGTVLTAVICRHADDAKRRLLADRSFDLASEWHTSRL